MSENRENNQSSARRRTLALSFLVIFACGLVAKKSWQDLEQPEKDALLVATGISKTKIRKETNDHRFKNDWERWDSVPCPGNTQPWHGCNLTDFYYGYPVILISFGRSGSTVTWDTMSALTSPRRGQKSAESTGRNTDLSLEPLEKMNQTEHGKCWMHRILCDHQEENRKLTKAGQGKSKIIGTKVRIGICVCVRARGNIQHDFLASSCTFDPKMLTFY